MQRESPFVSVARSWPCGAARASHLARAAALAAALCLVLFPPAVTPASAVVPARRGAEKPLWMHIAAGYCGARNADAPGGAMALAGGILYRIPDSPRWAVGGETGWLRAGSAVHTRRIPGAGRFESEYSLSAVPLTVHGYAFLPAGTASEVVLTGGVGLYSVSSKLSYHAAGAPVDESSNEAKPGVVLGAGFQFTPAQSALRVGLDIRHHWIEQDGEALRLLAIMGRVSF